MSGVVEDENDINHTLSVPLLHLKNDLGSVSTNNYKDGNESDKYFKKKRLVRVSSTRFTHTKLLETKKAKVFTDLMVRHNALYQHWKLADLITAIFTSTGLCLALIEYELGFENNHEQRNNISIGRNILRTAVLILSLASVVTI